MPRLMIDDPSGADPRALITVARIAAVSDIVAPENQYLSVILGTGDAVISVTPGVVITVGGAVFQTPAITLSAANLDSGVFQTGSDYYIYICDDGSDTERYIISLNTTFPSGFTMNNSRKIGGFHFGQCRRVDNMLRPTNSAGLAYGAGWESNVYLGIVPRSVWTLKHRPACSPEGMVYAGSKTWFDIYLSSDAGNGSVQSVMNGIPLTGTEGYNWPAWCDRALRTGKRMPTLEESFRAGHGAPQGNNGDNVNAWTMTTNAGRNPAGQIPNAVSSIGTRDDVGNVWKWTSDVTTNADGGRVFRGSTDPNPVPFIYASWDGSRGGLEAPATGSGHGQTTRALNTIDPPVQGWYAWDPVSPLGDTTGDGNPDNGNVWQCYDLQHTAYLYGGDWNSGVHAGSRALHASPNGLWRLYTSLGVRLACDSL